MRPSSSSPSFRRFSRSTAARAATAVAVLGAVALTPSRADASGYLTARFGSDYGTPAMPNTFAIYFNPAALGGTTGTTITGDVSLLLRWASYERGVDALSPSDPNTKNDPQYVAANTGRGNLLDVVPLPFFGVNTDFGLKNFRAGYAFYIPFGGMAEWQKREGVAGVPGSTDGIQRWHNISGQILAIYNTFAMAYRFEGPRLTIGASVSPVVHQVKTVRARNADGSDDTLAAGNNLVEGRSLLQVSGVNVGAAFGVYWEATDSVSLGLSYTTQPGFGTTRMHGTLQTQLGSTAPQTRDVDFLQTYPDVWRLGTVVKASDSLEVRGDLEYVRWSVFDKQCIVPRGSACDVADDGRDLSGGNVILNVPRRWHDSVGVRAGPVWHATQSTAIFGSLGLTTPAVPKETIDASTIDSQQLFGTVGVRHEFSEHVALAASYNHIYFIPVHTNGANDLNIEAHPSNSPDGGAYNASRSPSADGTYKAQVGFVNINAAYTF